jgi:hypothetical protein
MRNDCLYWLLKGVRHAEIPEGPATRSGPPARQPQQSTLLLDQLASEATESIVRSVQEQAEKGNMYAAAILLARTWPRRRGRPVQLDLPSAADTGGLVAAQAAVIAAMARGEISPDEATSIASVLETQRRAIETHDHERRLRELETKRAELSFFAEPPS